MFFLEEGCTMFKSLSFVTRYSLNDVNFLFKVLWQMIWTVCWNNFWNTKKVSVFFQIFFQLLLWLVD